jgi:hypothetical protein
VSTVPVPQPGGQHRTRPGDTRSVAVVIPIPDDPPWDLFDHIPANVPIIVSDDSNGNLAPPPRDNVWFFDYAAQEAYTGRHYAAMPHKSAASRNVGHYIAWKEGFDVIVALDYDCRTREGWLDAHLDTLAKVVEAPARRPADAAGWLNSIDNTFEAGGTVYARGYPYERRAPGLDDEVDTTATGEVKLNMGVWDGVLDLNGIDKFYGGEPGDPGVPDGPNRVAQGPVPLCGMNTAFAAELTPAYYFLPDIWVNGWQLSRHDDIWGGYIVERLMERRGDLLAYGNPVVGHTKQTRLERVVVLEQWMHLMSVPFYDVVDVAAAEVAPGPYAEMFGHFTEEYHRAVEASAAPSHYRAVYAELGGWMDRWAAAFK